MKNSLLLTFAIILSAFGSTAVQAAGSGSSRDQNKLGFTGGFFGDAFPSIFSWGLHYNLASKIRIGVGYGSLSSTSTASGGVATIKVTSYSVGAKFFPLAWSLSPFIGGQFTSTSADGNFTILGQSIGTTGSLKTTMLSFGLDHQARVGFNLGAGFHYILSPVLVKDVISLVPHFYLGWYF